MKQEGGKGKMGSGDRTHSFLLPGQISRCSSNSVRGPRQRQREQQTFVGCKRRGRRQTPDGGENEAKNMLLCWEIEEKGQEENGVKKQVLFQAPFAMFQTD